MPPIFYAYLRLGAWILDTPTRTFQVELSVEWLLYELNAIWQPLFLGSLVAAVFFACGGLFQPFTSIWRTHILRNLKKRRLNRIKRAAENEGF